MTRRTERWQFDRNERRSHRKQHRCTLTPAQLERMAARLAAAPTLPLIMSEPYLAGTCTMLGAGVLVALGHPSDGKPAPMVSVERDEAGRVTAVRTWRITPTNTHFGTTYTTAE